MFEVAALTTITSLCFMAQKDHDATFSNIVITSETRHGSSFSRVTTSQAAVTRSILASGTFFRGKEFPSSADSIRASCQLLAKEWTLNTCKLPPEGLPRNSVVK